MVSDPLTPCVGTRYSNRVFDAFDQCLSRDIYYILGSAIAVVLGWIAYAPMWGTHFFADDVDFFGGICASLQQGRFWQWIWTPINGHLSIPVRLGYYAVWRWFARDVFWWHVLTLFWWTAALLFANHLFRRIFASRAIAVGLLAVLACSAEYRSQIMDPPAANHLWSASAAMGSLWAAWLYLENRAPGFLAISLTAAMFSYLSVATGFLTFVFLITLSTVSLPPAASRRRLVLALTSGAGAAAALTIQFIVGDQTQAPNFVFGFSETCRGLWALSGRVIGSQSLSHLIVLVSMTILVCNYRRINSRLMFAGFVLMVGPLLFATIFREEFSGIGTASRYGFLPMLGACFWLGEAVRLLRVINPPRWLTPRRAFLVVGVFFACIAFYAMSKNVRLKTPNTDTLYNLEMQIKTVVEAYATTVDNERVLVPDRTIALPASPHERPLDFIARYSVTPTLNQSIIQAQSNPAFDRFVIERYPLWSRSFGVSNK